MVLNRLMIRILPRKNLKNSIESLWMKEKKIVFVEMYIE